MDLEKLCSDEDYVDFQLPYPDYNLKSPKYKLFSGRINELPFFLSGINMKGRRFDVPRRLITADELIERRIFAGRSNRWGWVNHKLRDAWWNYDIITADAFFRGQRPSRLFVHSSEILGGDLHEILSSGLTLDQFIELFNHDHSLYVPPQESIKIEGDTPHDAEVFRGLRWVPQSLGFIREGGSFIAGNPPSQRVWEYLSRGRFDLARYLRSSPLTLPSYASGFRRKYYSEESLEIDLGTDFDPLTMRFLKFNSAGNRKIISAETFSSDSKGYFVGVAQEPGTPPFVSSRRKRYYPPSKVFRPNKRSSNSSSKVPSSHWDQFNHRNGEIQLSGEGEFLDFEAPGILRKVQKIPKYRAMGLDDLLPHFLNGLDNKGRVIDAPRRLISFSELIHRQLTAPEEVRKNWLRKNFITSDLVCEGGPLSSDSYQIFRDYLKLAGFSADRFSVPSAAASFFSIPYPSPGEDEALLEQSGWREQEGSFVPRKAFIGNLWKYLTAETIDFDSYARLVEEEIYKSIRSARSNMYWVSRKLPDYNVPGGFLMHPEFEYPFMSVIGGDSSDAKKASKFIASKLGGRVMVNHPHPRLVGLTSDYDIHLSLHPDAINFKRRFFRERLHSSSFRWTSPGIYFVGVAEIPSELEQSYSSIGGELSVLPPSQQGALSVTDSNLEERVKEPSSWWERLKWW